jgi:predicted metal-binding membrane protein
MMLSGEERSRITLCILLISLGAWLLPHAGLSSFPARLSNWILMVMAMMTPTLITPVQHIFARSFRHLRARLLALFCLGYALVWIVAGAILLAIAAALTSQSAPAVLIPLVNLASVPLVILWQCSPLKQRCLNRAHSPPELAAFGFAADISALRMGLNHGLWCALSCWPLMALTLLTHHGHDDLMLVVTLVVISERLNLPEPLRWKLRIPGTLIKWVVGQARTLFQLLTAGQLLAAPPYPPPPLPGSSR